MNPRNYKHGGCAGGSSSPEYRAYQAMVSRCYNPNSDHWAYYGAREDIRFPRRNRLFTSLKSRFPKIGSRLEFRGRNRVFPTKFRLKLRN